MTLPKYGTHPIKCGKRGCIWVGYETHLNDVSDIISGVSVVVRVCPVCGCDSYSFMSTKQMSKAGLSVQDTN